MHSCQLMTVCFFGSNCKCHRLFADSDVVVAPEATLELRHTASWKMNHLYQSIVYQFYLFVAQRIVSFVNEFVMNLHIYAVISFYIITIIIIIIIIIIFFYPR